MKIITSQNAYVAMLAKKHTPTKTLGREFLPAYFLTQKAFKEITQGVAALEVPPNVFMVALGKKSTGNLIVGENSTFIAPKASFKTVVHKGKEALVQSYKQLFNINNGIV